MTIVTKNAVDARQLAPSDARTAFVRAAAVQAAAFLAPERVHASAVHTMATAVPLAETISIEPPTVS
jgi:hypothetical protein